MSVLRHAGAATVGADLQVPQQRARAVVLAGRHRGLQGGGLGQTGSSHRWRLESTEYGRLYAHNKSVNLLEHRWVRLLLFCFYCFVRDITRSSTKHTDQPPPPVTASATFPRSAGVFQPITREANQPPPTYGPAGAVASRQSGVGG
eukprot:9472465-Pyramimonas_sp.AAC.2